MADEIQTIADIGGTIAEKCLELGKVLNQDGPVSEDVLYAAIYDQSYAHNLLTCRKEPVFLKHLLASPPKVPAAQRVETLDEVSQLELIKKMSEAIWGWAKVGFTRIEDQIFQRRVSACMQCPNMIDAPDILSYRMATIRASNNKICRPCGCLISKKTRIPSESCPDADPQNPALTRWGDPIKQ